MCDQCGLRSDLPWDAVGSCQCHKPSGECMNGVYEMLRGLSIDHLQEMFAVAAFDANGGCQRSMLLRHQIAFTVDKKEAGAW